MILNGTGRHFQDQSIKIKQLDSLFDFRAIVVDINGPGAGIADFLLIEQEKDGKITEKSLRKVWLSR